MEENMQKELVEVLLKSGFSELVQVGFDENMAVCRQLGQPRTEFESAVNALANMWIPIAKRYGFRPVQFGAGNYGRLLEDNSLGIRFGSIDSETVKTMPNQNTR